MPLLNYTTKIDVEKTVGEIQKMLGLHGARAIMTEYDDEGIITSLSFRIRVGEQEPSFRLPCDWRPVLEVMENDRKVPRSSCNQIQAVRVAWRIVKDWVEAQMAFIDSRQVRTEQVFLSYAVMKDGQTMFDHIAKKQFLLGDGK